MTKFKMFGIHLDQFAILCEDGKDEIGMNVNLNFKYGDEGRKVACVVAFNFTSESEKVMVLKVTCDFEITEDDWKAFRKGEEVVIPKDLLEFFAVHTIGTARGVLFCKTENTQFNYVVIPPINVSEMGINDLVIKSEPKEDESRSQASHDS